MCKIIKTLTTVYMASPYTSYDEGEVKFELDSDRLGDAYHLAVQGAAYLMEEYGYAVFSPIVHSHPIDRYVQRPDHSYWLTQDYYWVKACDEMYILQLDGWENSFGIGVEIGIATVLDKPIHYLPFEEVEEWLRSKDE